MTYPNTFRTLASILVFLAAGAPSIFGQVRERNVAARSPEQEIRAVLTKWATAVKNHDVAELDRLFAEDLFITDYNGGTRGKKEELEILKPSSSSTTIFVENENVNIRMFSKSNAAVVTAVVKMVFRTAERDSSMAMRYTSIWEKRGGRWQLTILQTARVPAR